MLGAKRPDSKFGSGYDMLPLMEMMEAPDKSEFFYRHRTEDGWEKEIF